MLDENKRGIKNSDCDEIKNIKSVEIINSCAPTRNAILTGVYATSNGNQHMRSKYAKSDIVVPYPVYLRETGYYCTINSKTDSNIGNVKAEEIWGESSNTAHWKNRNPDDYTNKK